MTMMGPGPGTTGKTSSSSDNNGNNNYSNNSSTHSVSVSTGDGRTTTSATNMNMGTRGYTAGYHLANTNNPPPSNPHQGVNSDSGGSNGLNHYHHRGNVVGDSRLNNTSNLASPTTSTHNSGEQMQQQQYSRSSNTNNNSYRGLSDSGSVGGSIKSVGSGGVTSTNTPYRGNSSVGGGTVGRGVGNNSKIMGDTLFSNSNSAAAHREREMMNIYGGGSGGNSIIGSGAGTVPGGGASVGGGRGGRSYYLNDFDGPNKSNNFPQNESDSFESIRSGGLHDSTGDGQLHKRKYHNPCRFTGHDHDWKDCPNNFRNKKRLRTAIPGRGGAPGCDRVIMAGGRGAHHHHGGAGGGMGFTETDKTTTGHYGPAAVQSSGAVEPRYSGGIGATNDRNAPFSTSYRELDRVSIVDRGTSAGDRGYDVPSTLVGSRSKSFGEDLSQRGNVVGSGGGRISSSGNIFSPKPAILGDRQWTWHQGDKRGGGDSMFTPQLMPQPQPHLLGGGDKGANTKDSNTFSPSSSKPLLEQQQQQRNNTLHPNMAHQQHRQTQLAPQQQPLLRSPSTPSPIMTIKNERGYSFTPPAALKRSRSSGSDHPCQSGIVGGNQDHRNSNAHFLLSSPGEVYSATKRVISNDNAVGRTFTGGQGIVEAKENGECGNSGGKSSAGTTPRSLMSSPLFRHGGNLSEDIAAPSPSKIDSLYADLALPSPWSTNRQFVTAASSIASPLCASPMLPREKRPLTSPGEILVDGDQHIAISDSSSTNKGDTSIPPPSPASAIENNIKLPSLTCSSLVELDKIRKAENIVAAMVKLVDFNAFESVDREAGVGVPLPSKMQITRAMGLLETKIKLKTEMADAVRKEVKAIQIQEREEAERFEKIEREEDERIAKEEEELVRRIQNEHDANRMEREDTVSKKLSELSSHYDARKSALQEKRQADVLQMQELCKSDVQSRVGEINSQVSTLDGQLREVKRQIAELENIQKQRDIEISQTSSPPWMSSSASDGNTQRPPIIFTENDMTTNKKHTQMDLPGKMSELVANIIAQNQMVAKRSHLDVLGGITFFPGAEDDDALAGDITSRDNNENNTSISNQVWSNRARRVTGQFNALYTEPTEVPYYHENNERFIEIAPLIKECIRRKNEKLKSRWVMLAEHYSLRQMIYNEQTGMNGDMSERGGHFSMVGGLLGGRGASYDSINIMETSSTSTPNCKTGSDGGPQHNPGVRGNNPYRRPRRGISLGDVVRSDYEQEQIIAEIAAKEAMEKRIKEGGCALPRQRGWLENRIFASHTDGFFGHRIFDPLADEEERRNINIWSDMEKCIFFDRFLQHPKDFRRIASFLKNKSTKDCIAFYYHSKKTVPYKHSLKEFMQRKKCRGDVVSWDATIQACLSMGAVIKAGTSLERPLKFILPESDFTYHTRHFHPMRLEVFKNLKEIVSISKQRDDGKANLGKRKRSNWFILDVREKKYLRHGDICDDHHVLKRNMEASVTDINSDDGDSNHNVIKSKPTRVKTIKADKVHSDVQGNREGVPKHQNDVQQSHKPQKWKVKEKELFFHALNKFGHDWSAIAEAVGTRTHTQVKNYFYDNKKTIAKQKEKKRDVGEKRNKKAPEEKRATESELCHTDVALEGISLNSEVVASTDSSNNSISETESLLIAQQTYGEIQVDQYRQHQFHLHQQQHLDQLRLEHQQQQHFQQQQHIERLMQQQRQEDLYRQQIQQEELYRHHLRQQEMLHAAQRAQQLQHQQLHAHHHQSNQYHEAANQVSHQQIDPLQSLLALRNTDHSPHLHRQNQMNGYGNTGGGEQQQHHPHSGLESVYKAALAAGVPLSTLESALAAVRGGGGGQRHENHQQQAMSMELLRRLGYVDDHYQR